MVSIIMPALNAELSIREAIASVLLQDHENWELLVVDNGSTDGTAALVLGIGDPRVILLKEPRRGVSIARNCGLLAMNGGFYCFLDADDILPTRSISARLGLLQHDPGLFFADGAMEAFDNRSGNILWRRTPTFAGYPRGELLALNESCFIGNTWMVRRQAGFPPLFMEGLTHTEDLHYFLSISNAGRYAFVDEVVLRYRIGHGSAMSDLAGLHQGYRKLISSMHRLHPPPEAKVISQAWAKVQGVMAKSYLKAGKPLLAWRSWYEKEPQGCGGAQVGP
jgi:glycosyltransferase involved in cell wall biosynthesis